MATPLVYVPQQVHPDAMELLSQHAQVVVGYGPEGQPLSEVAAEVSAILIRTSPLTADDLRTTPKLKIVARHGVGTDNIDIEAATRQKVAVTNTPDANARSVAEHVFALLLAVTRNLVIADRAVRDGRFSDRDEIGGTELAGRRLGIVGMGRIGSQVARIAADGFDMEVWGYDPNLSPDAISARGAKPVEDFHGLLAVSDVLTVHVPLLPSTANLIGDAELRLLPAGAVVLLTARGGVVEESALIAHLQDGTLAGAGLDVFEFEPPQPDSGFFQLPNVVLTPHSAALTDAALRRMAVGAAESIVTMLEGGRPEHIVNAAGLAANPA